MWHNGHHRMGSADTELIWIILQPCQVHLLLNLQTPLLQKTNLPLFDNTPCYAGEFYILLERIIHIHLQTSSLLTIVMAVLLSLQWRHNGRDSLSNHQPYECLLSRLIRHRTKKTSKLRVTGLCAGNSPESGEFPAQRANNAENVSIPRRYHVKETWMCRQCGTLINTIAISLPS